MGVVLSVVGTDGSWAKHLVGAEVEEALEVGELAGCFKQVHGSHDIGCHEGASVGDRAVHVGFGGQVEDVLGVFQFSQYGFASKRLTFVISGIILLVRGTPLTHIKCKLSNYYMGLGLILST